MSDKNPHTSERIQDSHHQGGAPFSNPRRSQTSTTVQHKTRCPLRMPGRMRTPRPRRQRRIRKTRRLKSPLRNLPRIPRPRALTLPSPHRGAHRPQSPSLPRPRALNPPPLRSIRTPLRRRFPRAFHARTLTRLFTTKILRPVSCQYRADLSRAR